MNELIKKWQMRISKQYPATQIPKCFWGFQWIWLQSPRALRLDHNGLMGKNREEPIIQPSKNRQNKPNPETQIQKATSFPRNVSIDSLQMRVNFEQVRLRNEHKGPN